MPEYRCKLPFTATQYFPGVKIEGVFETEDNQAYIAQSRNYISVCEGDWVVRDSDGDLTVYTNEDFREAFEEIVGETPKPGLGGEAPK